MDLIAHCGEVEVATGEFEYGQFYGFWGDDTCYEVYKTDVYSGGKIRVVATAGTTPITKLGEFNAFITNDDNPFTFEGEVIDVVVGDKGFKSLREKYGDYIDVSTYK